MADDASTQQPADKAPAPATFSSFINKNTSGKKFAPKAARRRPGAAAASASVSAPVSASALKPTAQSATAAAEPHISPAELPSTSAADAQLPTPAPTQETPITAPAPAAPTAQQNPEPTPTLSATAEQPRPAQDPQPASQPPEDDIERGRSPKRRRIDPSSRQSTPAVPVAVMVPPQHAQTGDASPHHYAPLSESASASSVDTHASADAIPSAQLEAPAQQKRTKPNLPWTAVNHPQDEGGEASEATEPLAKKKRAPPKPRGKKGAPQLADELGAQPEAADEEEAEPTQMRPSARGRGKRSADAAEGVEDDGAAGSTTNKPRKPRKDKGKQRAVEGEQVEGDLRQDGDAPAKTKRKPRAPKKRSTAPVQAKDGSEEPKRRGRPPREDTPSDAEDHTIDPDMMCMDDLASRNIRVGKLSRREKEMRKIDWDAVKERRREEDARHISTKETQAAVDKLLESGDVESVPTGPRYHVVDGRIELIQDSGTIDRERDADREIDAMLITEEDDLTTRITSRSFMKNNKRFPNEFVLPGQGKRWNHQSTDLFYQGLRSFGTDFQMIAHMFPGMTRRSIKTKFTREERENPEIVRDCLRGKSELASHWDHFLAASQMEEESFADADAIKRDLEEEEARMREQINEALKEKEEREKQKKLAGLTEDGDGAADNPNGKGKKKRKQKDKTVTFQEEGVEILGEVDDDPNWGQE